MFKKLGTDLYGAKINGHSFVLRYGEVGLLGYGRCWRLYCVDSGKEQFVTHFVVKDDSNCCYLKGESRCLWTDMNTLIWTAEEIATNYSNIL